MRRLESSRRTHEVLAGGRVIAPGASASYEIRTRAGQRFLSLAFMLVNTNDERQASISGPCRGSVGTGEPTR